MSTNVTPVGEPTFKLGAFDLDAKGNVAQGGKWATANDNQIVVTTTAGNKQTFAAAWAFNAKNELVLSAGGQQLFNFSDKQGITPRFELRNAVLRVTPNMLNPFVFELRGEWGFTTSHDLEFTPVNGTRSTITGFVSSPVSKFVFFFSDKTRPLLKQKLGFVGTWDTHRKNEGVLIFNFRREDGSTDTFELPGTITVNRTTNQLRYEYKKGGVQAIDFEGTLVVSEDLVISYHLARQLSSTGEVMVPETTLSFGAVYQKKDFSGNLELTLTKPDGSVGTTKLTIAGKFVGVLGKTNLTVGFQFTQVRAGQTVTTTFGIAGSLQFSAGTVVFGFKFTNGGNPTINLTVGADVQLGPAHIDARLNLDVGGGAVQGVTLLLGVRF